MRILVTGGSGSFGRQFVKLALSKPDVERVVIYSRDEGKHAAMQAEGFDDPRLRYFIGDVRDRERLTQAMKGIDIVAHAAALKRVEAGEYNFEEFIKTNLLGTQNVAKAAIANRAKKAIMLSSDKACEASTSYGISKAAAELAFISGNIESGQADPVFACVRYGNVLGSRGSVVPLWQEQRKTGRITITDPNMSRFFLPLKRAADFVWLSLEIMAGGEIFVPLLPSVRIGDLAEMIAPGCAWDEVGIRGSEKQHEAMVSEWESYRGVLRLSDRYVILPSFRLPCHDRWADACRMPAHFSYDSSNNDHWLSKEELEVMLNGEL